MAGIVITEDGQLRRYELRKANYSLNEVVSGSRFSLMFDVYNNTTGAKLWSYECMISGANAVTLYNNVKSSGIRNYYVSLCTEKNISTNIVPSNMESEVIA